MTTYRPTKFYQLKVCKNGNKEIINTLHLLNYIIYNMYGKVGLQMATIWIFNYVKTWLFCNFSILPLFLNVFSI